MNYASFGGERWKDGTQLEEEDADYRRRARGRLQSPGKRDEKWMAKKIVYAMEGIEKDMTKKRGYSHINDHN